MARYNTGDIIRKWGSAESVDFYVRKVAGGKSWTVTYKSHDGTETLHTESVPDGADATWGEGELWSLDASGAAYKEPLSCITGDTVLYATDAIVYGFIEHMDIPEPDARMEYIEWNEGYAPIEIDLTEHTYDLGDWAGFSWLQENAPYMVKSDGTADYRLDENDYSKKLDGTASDVSNASYSGGAFSWAPVIYKKEQMDGTDRIVRFATAPLDGFSPVGFVDKDGDTLSGRWIPMFYGSVASGKAQTIAGTTGSKSLTTDQQASAIAAFSTKANFFGGPFAETLTDIAYMISKNTNSRYFYGHGNSDGGSEGAMKPNEIVGGGQFYGSSDGRSCNKIFHSIVLGTYNQWMRDPYELNVNGRIKVSTDYSMDLSGDSYTDTGINCSSGEGYINAVRTVEGYGAVPVAPYDASDSTGSCDYVWANNSGVKVCLRFGRCGDGSRDGLRARSWDGAASRTDWHHGFAVLLDAPAIAAP